MGMIYHTKDYFGWSNLEIFAGFRKYVWYYVLRL